MDLSRLLVVDGLTSKHLLPRSTEVHIGTRALADPSAPTYHLPSWIDARSDRPRYRVVRRDPKSGAIIEEEFLTLCGWAYAKWRDDGRPKWRERSVRIRLEYAQAFAVPCRRCLAALERIDRLEAAS